MIEKQSGNREAIAVKFQLPLEKPSAEAKKTKKDVPSERQTARKIVLKTEDQQKQVSILYNAQIESLKIKYENYKVVYSYLEFPQKIKECYENTYQLFHSLKFKNKKISVNTDTKCLTFSDKRKPRPKQPIIAPQQIPENEGYETFFLNDKIFELEQSIQILRLVRGSRRNLLAEHYAALGKEYLRLSLYRRAKQNFDMAFEVFKQLYPERRTEECARLHHELGRLYIQQGEKMNPDLKQKKTFLKDYQQSAIREFEGARDILQSIKNSNLAEIKATVFNSLGSAYSRSDPQKANHYFRKALSHTELLDKSSSACFQANLNLGRLNIKRKDYIQAYKDLHQYRQMLSLGRQDKRMLFKIDCQLQYACLGLKRYEQGLKIIIEMDRSLKSTIDTILSQWSRAFAVADVYDSSIIAPMQTLLTLLHQNCDLEIPMNDPKIRATTAKLELMRRE